MNELLNDEKLTTADLVNPPRTTANSNGIPGPDGFEDGRNRVQVVLRS